MAFSKPAAQEHGHQLGRRVHARGERAGLAAAVGVDQRLGLLRDPADRVERALLQQQAPLAGALPAGLVEGPHQEVAVHRLDDQPAAGPQHARDLREDLRVVGVAEVPERGVQVDRGVEGGVRERQLAVVAEDPPGPVAIGAPLCLLEERRGAVDGGDGEAILRERDRVAAEAARDVEQRAAGRALRQHRRGARLAGGHLGLSMGLRRVDAQVEVAEEVVPRLLRARGATVGHGRGSLGAGGGARPRSRARQQPGQHQLGAAQVLGHDPHRPVGVAARGCR